MNLSGYAKKFEAAVDQSVSDFLQLTQGKLIKANPKDSGRMSSSWVIGHNAVNPQTRPKDWAPPGAKKVQMQDYTGKITASGDWYISNSVPYSIKVALDPRYPGGDGGEGSGNWYTAITTQLQNDLDRQVIKQLRRIR